MNKKQLIVALSWGWLVLVVLFFSIKGLGYLYNQHLRLAIICVFLIPLLVIFGNYVLLKLFWNKKK